MHHESLMKFPQIHNFNKDKYWSKWTIGNEVFDEMSYKRTITKLALA
jgi:hypothetical protein